MARLVPAALAALILAIGVSALSAGGATAGVEYNAADVWASSSIEGQLGILFIPLNVSDTSIISYKNTYVLSQTGEPMYSYLFSSIPPLVLVLEPSITTKSYNVWYGGGNPYTDSIALPGSDKSLFAAYDDFDYDTGMWNTTNTTIANGLALITDGYMVLNTTYEPRVAALWLVTGVRNYLHIVLYSDTGYTGWVTLTINSTMFPDWESLQPDGSDIYFLDADGNPLHYSIHHIDTANRLLIVSVEVSLNPGYTEILMGYGQANPYQNYRV